MSLNPTGPEWTNGNVPSVTTIGLSNGALLTLWVESDLGGGGAIRGSISNPDGSGSTGPFLIKSAATGMLFLPSATALSGGRFVVAWSHNTDGFGDFRLETQVFKNDGTPESVIARIGSNLASEPHLVTLASGGYAMAYRDDGFKAVTFSPTGAPGESIALPPGYSQSAAALATGGYVTVVEKYSDDFSSSAIYAYLRDSNGQVTEKAVTGFANRGEMQVAGLANGNFVVVWLDRSGIGNALKAQLVNAQGNSVGGELTLYRNAAGAREELTVKALPEGGFTVAFVQREAETDVHVGVYSASGDVITPPSAIGRTVAGLQFNPSIAVLKDGRYVMSWSDASDNSVHLQAYDPRTKGVTVSGDDANDRFTGTGFGDVLTGAGGNDRLVGEGGNDVLDGGFGGDLMFGGAGNDTYYIDSSDDRIVEWENAGEDHLITRVSQNLWDEVENLTALGSEDITLNGNTLSNRIAGNTGQNVLNGKAGNDSLDGGSGADSLIGGAGDDTFYVDHAGDQVVEVQGGGRDTVHAMVSVSLGAGQEVEVLTATGSAAINLTGSAYANTLNGNAGNNIIRGEAGEDRLSGGLGQDTLWGQSGRDTFVFDDRDTSSSKSRADYIVDFSGRGGEKIELRLIDANTKKGGDQNFSFIGTKAFSKAGEVRYEKTKSYTYVYLNTDSDKAAEAVIKLKGAMTLQKGWFVL